MGCIVLYENNMCIYGRSSLKVPVHVVHTQSPKTSNFLDMTEGAMFYPQQQVTQVISFYLLLVLNKLYSICNVVSPNVAHVRPYHR